MTPPLYTTIYSEALNRPEYYKVRPDEAVKKLQDYPYLPGTYLISQGEGAFELLFTFVHLDRRIYQFIAKLVFNENKYCWAFNETTFNSIHQLILKSKLYGFCFLLFAYTPLLKLEGFVPAILTNEIAFQLAKEGEEGDYFVTNDMESKPWILKIVRYSRERNEVDIYLRKARESSVKLSRAVKRKIGLKRPVCLTDSTLAMENFVINTLVELSKK